MEIRYSNNSVLGGTALLEANNEETVRHIPVIVFLLIVCVTGIVGNLLVLVVYITDYNRSNCRTFIICLASVDLLSCVVELPLEIYGMFNQYTFQRDWLCKLTYLLKAWPTITSGFILLSIAIDRYRKVCKPFGWQISQRTAVYMCIGNLILGTTFSWTSPVIYGVRVSILKAHNITVQECVEDRTEMENTIFPLLKNISFAILFVGVFGPVLIMYFLIGVRLRRHTRKKHMWNTANLDKDRKTVGESLHVNANSVTALKEQSNINAADILESEINSDGRRQETDTYSVDYEITTTTAEGFRKANNSKILSRDYKSKKNKHENQGTVLIMFLISLAFILTYVPILCVLLIRNATNNFTANLTDGERAAYTFSLRSCYLNCAINPIIYGLWVDKFRRSCKQLVCKVCSAFRSICFPRQ